MLIQVSSAGNIWFYGDKECAQNHKCSFTIRTSADNFIAFQLYILVPEGVEIIQVEKGKDIREWAFTYNVLEEYYEINENVYDKRLEIIGIGKEKPPAGTKEIALITFKPRISKNLTFIIDRESTKFVDPNEREIKINRFYNHSVRVYRYGDVNMDNEVDVKDLIRLERIILTEEESTITSDLNDDGSVNILDLVKLINLLVSV